MADDIFETDEQETLEMDEVLEKVISYCAEEAKEKLAQVGSFEPFTVIVEGENMHIESHPGDDPEVIRERAREAVATASSFASHYCFCFDGFIDTDEGEMDAIVIEAAEREQEEAFAIVNLYRVGDEGEGTLEFDDQLAFVAMTQTWFNRAAVEAGDAEEMAKAQEEMAAAQQRAEARAKAQELQARLQAEKE